MVGAKFALFTLLTAANTLIGACNANPTIVPSTTMQGVYSDVQMVILHQDVESFPLPETFPNPDQYIKPVDPDGIVVPTTTVEVKTERIFLDAPSPYDVGCSGRGRGPGWGSSDY